MQTQLSLIGRLPYKKPFCQVARFKLRIWCNSDKLHQDEHSKVQACNLDSLNTNLIHINYEKLCLTGEQPDEEVRNIGKRKTISENKIIQRDLAKNFQILRQAENFFCRSSQK